MRKLLGICQFLPGPQYIAPNNWVIETNGGLQKMGERQTVINLPSSF